MSGGRIMKKTYLLIICVLTLFICLIRCFPIQDKKVSKIECMIVKKDTFKPSIDTMKITYYNYGKKTASGLCLINKKNDGYCIASISRYDKRYKLGDTITIKSKYISCKAIICDYTRKDIVNCVDVYVGTDNKGIISKINK